MDGLLPPPLINLQLSSLVHLLTDLFSFEAHIVHLSAIATQCDTYPLSLDIGRDVASRRMMISEILSPDCSFNVSGRREVSWNYRITAFVRRSNFTSIWVAAVFCLKTFSLEPIPFCKTL